jgi:glutamyl-tRNA synthetase
LGYNLRLKEEEGTKENMNFGLDKAVLRFAPSPTGHVHIGNIRVAIFNWLYARHSGGKFLLRVEDTDRERSTAEAAGTLIEAMKWLGLDWDDEILYQSTRATEHIKAVEKLLGSGNIFSPVSENSAGSPFIFLIPYDCRKIPFVREKEIVELDIAGDKDVVIGPASVSFSSITNGKELEKSASPAGFYQMKVFDKENKLIFELDNEIDKIRGGVGQIRVPSAAKMTYIRREVFFNDAVKGELSKPLDTVKDFVIVRSDGAPVFHLANVCDDVFQNVNLIMRGDDHVENTFRHLFIFNALGAEIPRYAHLPMIVNQSGKPYSKRDGDAYVGDFKSKGFLPDALFNYLALLGWAPGDDREKMSKDELKTAFSIDRIKSSPAKFDIQKLLNMNGLYIAEMKPGDFAKIAKEFIPPEWESGGKIDERRFSEISLFMQSRTKTFSQVPEWKYFFYDTFKINEKELVKVLSKTGVKEALRIFAENIEKMEDPSAEAIETAMRHTEESVRLDKGRINQSIRLAATGMSAGPGLAETIKMIGTKKTAKRILSKI